MSSFTKSSGGCSRVLLAVALVSCGGSSGKDLFAPTTGTGPCVGASCGTSGAPGTGGHAGATMVTTAGTGGSATSSSTTGQGTGGQGTTSSGAGGTGGVTTTGGAGTTGGGPPGGTGGQAGDPTIDAGITPGDATAADAPIDSGHVTDAIVRQDACVPTGMEVCDGIDNNCQGGIDENACRDGCVGVEYLGVGHMLCFGQNQHRQWREAEMDCQNHRMHLIRVNDATQNTWIRKTAAGQNFNGIIWIGGSDSNREGTWLWTDGTQFWMGGINGRTVGGQFAAWDMGQPNSAQGPEDCAAMWLNVSTWHDADCLTRYAYMCQGIAPIR